MVSDTQVMTSQLEQCLAGHLQEVRSADLYSLVMPPPEGPLKCKSGLPGDSGLFFLGLGPRRCPEFEDQQLQVAAGHPGGAFEGKQNREFCGVCGLHHTSLAELVSTMRHFGGAAKHGLQEVERVAEIKGT